MHSRLFLRTILPLLGSVFALTAVGHAVLPNRISSIATESRTPLQHTVSPRVKAAADLGSALSSRILDNLTLRFSMTAAQQAALTQLLADQQNPSSPRYHQWLTPDQFGAQFGLSSGDIDKVSAWLTSQGFTVTGVARSSTFITFKGTVAQAQRAFNTSIHNLSVDGEQHFSNTTDAALPPSIAGVVSTITGLNNFRLKTRAHVRSVNANTLQPQFTSSVSGGHYMAPGDFYTIYDVNSLINNGITGAGVGQCSTKPAGAICGDIAIVGQVDLSLADVAAFRSASGLAANVPIIQLYGTDPGPATSATSTPSTNDLDEAQLDVEWAGASAPSAKIVYVNSKDVINISLTHAIDDNLAPIISISYGECEAAAGISGMNSFNQLFQMANAMGITIVGPSGDSGATDCDYHSATATEGLAVDFPGSSPFVTSAGGTMFNEGSDTTSYWSASNGTNSGSAIKYIPEAVWNESSSTSLGAGGGGASAFFAKPAWQTGTGVPSDFARDVPDISLNAAFNHDGYLLCVQGSCANGFRNAAGNLSVVGGTSVAAPTFAGMLALVQQKIGSRIGNANPVLYGLANSTYYYNVFHDVVTGNNSSVCEPGTPNCPNGGSIGYNAGSGYDLATGWGTINAFNLAYMWTLVTPAGGGSATGTTLSATSLTTSKSICGLTGGSLPLTVTVINGTFNSSGSPVVGPTPTGAVQFLVDNAVVGSGTLDSNGKATYTLDTSTLSSGGHTISAVYSGSSTYAQSRGTLLASDGSLTPIDLVSSSNPDFSISPCTASATVKSGSSTSGIVLTLAPFNGFTGTIKLTANVDKTIAAAYTFSTGSSVTINSNTSVPTTFTLSAFQTNANTATALVKIASNDPPAGKTPWYIAGSGATLACMFLVLVPRRRRWGTLLALIISTGVIGGALGCGSGTSAATTPTQTNPSSTNAAPGTYNITITAVASTTAGNVVHSTTLLVTVQ
jgi:subtilase family serine protease